MQKPVPAEKLTQALFRKHPIWEFCNDDEAGETLVRPVKKLPVSSMDNRLIGCVLKLADGSELFGYLGNLSPNVAKMNQQFLTISVFMDGKNEHLARYHDFDFSERGPAWLAKKLGKKKTEIFPIKYDVSAFVKGASRCIRGVIPEKPAKRLSRTQLMDLVLME
jgi:hypothetical protein